VARDDRNRELLLPGIVNPISATTSRSANAIHAIVDESFTT